MMKIQAGDNSIELIEGDCLEVMQQMPDNSVDLVVGSPPYEDARTYGIDYALKDEDFVAWCKVRFMECLRVSRGLVAWVLEGKTRNYAWSATPALLMADLKRAGATLRKPPAYRRIGIPGSGGPDWWRNDYEFVICATSGGKLPWSDNTATGRPPKYGPGGAMSNRTKSGQRKHNPGRRANGKTEAQTYRPPAKANPGNVVEEQYSASEVVRLLFEASDVIDCGAVGGGNIGSRLAHENEAPFPERLAGSLILSFCPPGGVVLDPFAGSGTSLAVATQTGRNSIGIDIRASQLELCERRLREVCPDLTVA